MKKSFFFYKELTPAEVGKTGTHEVYIRMPNNFDYETFFGNSSVVNGTVIEVSFTANDLTNGGDEAIPLRFVYFVNSNREKRIPSLGPLFKKHNVQDGDIVCLESTIDGESFFYNLCFYKKGEIEVNPSSIYFSSIERELSPKKNQSHANQPLQQIFYGAPGTGKSNTILEQTAQAEKEGRVFRTTFHPDSDYSTFVGCYKPSMKSSERIYSLEELTAKLKEIKTSGTTYPCHKFGARYWKSLKDLSAENIKRILTACGFTETMNVEVSKGIAIGQEYLNNSEDGKIVYAFTPQAFTNAYVKAWNTTENVYLIIEEINRGNCAQIFGDLFQLLDRKDGKSKYPIDADTDLMIYLSNELAKSTRDDFPEDVKEGKKLVLPPNLYIWATMNTSDQSLFPIDSAFKRRWDWKYIPISEGRDKNGQTCNWVIEADTQKYSWWSFVQKINDEIYEKTNSEDKKLGYYFCIANNGIITVETFVSKVLFYLWNDVFKDFGSDNGLFTESYDKFYDCDSKGIPFINKDKVQDLLNRLKVQVVGDIEEVDSEGDAGQERQYSTARFKLNGEGRFGKSRIALEALKVYANANPEATGTDIVNAWSVLGIPNMIETSETHADRVDRSDDDKISGKWNELRLHNGEFIYLTNQFRGEKINTFISAVNAQPWGMHIEKIEE